LTTEYTADSIRVLKGLEGRPHAPRHVRAGRHRHRRLPPAAGRDHRQRDRRGAGGPRRHDRGRAPRGRLRRGQRRRARHPGGPHEGRRAPGDRGHLHRAACGRQVRLGVVQGLGGPARRRLVGRQRALHLPRGRRLPGRPPPPHPLRLRRRHLPGPGHRSGARRPTRLHGHVPTRPARVQGGRGLRLRPRPPAPARPRLPHGRRQDRARGPPPPRGAARGLPRGGRRGRLRRLPRARGQEALRGAAAPAADVTVERDGKARRSTSRSA
jgi:hypothetical protein